MNFYVICTLVSVIKPSTLSSKAIPSDGPDKKALKPGELLFMLEEFGKLNYEDVNHNKTFLLLTDFLLDAEPTDKSKLNTIKSKKSDHQNSLQLLKTILEYVKPVDIQQTLDYEVVSRDEILYLLGKFLTPGITSEKNRPENDNFLKKLKILETFLTSESLEDVKTNEMPKIISASQEDKLKLLEDFLITEDFTKIENPEILKKNDENYQKRLKFLRDFLLSKNPENIDEDEKIKTNTDYQEMLKHFKEFTTLKKVKEDGTQDFYQKAIIFSKELLLSDAVTGAEYLLKLYSKRKQYGDILLLLRNFLISDDSKDAKQKPLTPEIAKRQETIRNTPNSVGLTHDLSRNDLNRQNIQQRVLPVEPGHRADQAQEILRFADGNKQEKLNLLGEFLVTGCLTEIGEIESLEEDKINYEKRLKLLGDFLLSKPSTDTDEVTKKNLEEKFKDILKLFENSDEIKKLSMAKNGQDSVPEYDHNEAFNILKKFLITDMPYKVGDLESLSSECEKYSETLFLLGEFLLFGSLKDAKTKTMIPEEMMLGDSPSAGRTSDLPVQDEININNVVHHATQQKNAQVSIIPANVHVDISPEDKLELFGEFLIEVNFSDADDKLKNFQNNDINYQKKLKFLGDFILSENPTKISEHERMSSEEDYKKMMQLFKNSLKSFEVMNIGRRGEGAERNYQEFLTLLRDFILSGTQSNLEDLERLGSSERYQESLALLSNFLFFDESGNSKLQKKNIFKSKVLEEEEEAMQNDSPSTIKPATVDAENVLDSDDVDEQETLSFEEEEYNSETMKLDHLNHKKLRDLKKKKRTNARRTKIYVIRHNSQADEADGKKPKTKTPLGKLVVIKNEKDFDITKKYKSDQDSSLMGDDPNVTHVDKINEGSKMYVSTKRPKTNYYDSLSSSSPKNLINDQKIDFSVKSDHHKSFKQANVSDNPKHFISVNPPDGVVKKSVVADQPLVSKSSDVKDRPKNIFQDKDHDSVVDKRQVKESQNLTILIFTVSRRKL